MKFIDENGRVGGKINLVDLLVLILVLLVIVVIAARLGVADQTEKSPPIPTEPTKNGYISEKCLLFFAEYDTIKRDALPEPDTVPPRRRSETFRSQGGLSNAGTHEAGHQPGSC